MQDIRGLLRRSFDLRHTDPAGALAAARTAARAADKIADYDLQAEAHGALSNALRVCNRLLESWQTMRRAWLCHGSGTQPRSLTAQLEDWRASLFLDARRFPEARQSIEHALLLRKDGEDRRALGRTLILRSVVVGFMGEPRRATTGLFRAMSCISPEDDSMLASILLHDLAWFLVEDSRADGALQVIEERDGDQRLRPAGRESLLRDRWLRARILAALGGRDLAASELRHVQAEFIKASRPYDSALAGLDLALVQRPAEALQTLQAIQPIFSVLGIRRENVASQLLAHALAGGALEILIPRILQAVRIAPLPFRKAGAQ